MNFAEVRFWALLAAGLAAIALLRLALRARLGPSRDAFDRWALMALGLFLLACVSLLTVTIFVLAALCSFLGMRWLSRHPHTRRPWYLIVLVPLLLLPLLYYKYANFVLNQVLGFDIASLRDLLIPVGISFYLFQMVGFVVDT